VLASEPTRAQSLADTLSFRFRLDSITIDLSFSDNAKRWEDFEQKFHNQYRDVPAHDLRLDIYSGASPEGSASHNMWLGENRGQSIRRFVREPLRALQRHHRPYLRRVGNAEDRS